MAWDRHFALQYYRARRHLFENRMDSIQTRRGCQHCGHESPAAWCFDFHHLRDKAFPLHNAANFSWSKVVAELEKCAVLCVMCHRYVHIFGPNKELRPLRLRPHERQNPSTFAQIKDYLKNFTKNP